jgi:hypothetical protein
MCSYLWDFTWCYILKWNLWTTVSNLFMIRIPRIFSFYFLTLYLMICIYIRYFLNFLPSVCIWCNRSLLNFISYNLLFRVRSSNIILLINVLLCNSWISSSVHNTWHFKISISLLKQFLNLNQLIIFVTFIRRIWIFDVESFVSLKLNEINWVYLFRFFASEILLKSTIVINLVPLRRL